MKISIYISFIILVLFRIGSLFPVIPEQLIFNIRNPKTDAKAFRDSLESIGEYLALHALTRLPKKTSFYTNYDRG